MIATRENVERWRVGGPLDALVVLDAVELRRGAIFQVTAQWHGRGPAPAGGQPDTRGTFVRYYDAAAIELARAVAAAAVEQLRAGAEPDLQAIARQLKARGVSRSAHRRDGAELVRGPGGAVILGDVDEQLGR